MLSSVGLVTVTITALYIMLPFSLPLLVVESQKKQAIRRAETLRIQ